VSVSTVGSGLYLSPSETDQRKVNTVIRQLLEGRSNAVGTFTVNPSTTLTTVITPNVGLQSIILWQPTTANAAAQMATLYCATTDVAKGQFTLHHASNATTDQIFNYLAVG
jgi:hypothetical protein